MRLSHAASLCQGTVCGADVEFVRVCTDTRSILAGDLFVALRGDRFDGHDFIAAAAADGASTSTALVPVLGSRRRSR